MSRLRLSLVLLGLTAALAAASAAASSPVTGLYGSGGRTLAVVDDPYGPPRLVDLDSGAVHALYADGGGFVAGTGFATRGAGTGAVRFERGALRLDGDV